MKGVLTGQCLTVPGNELSLGGAVPPMSLNVTSDVKASKIQKIKDLLNTLCMCVLLLFKVGWLEKI